MSHSVRVSVRPREWPGRTQFTGTHALAADATNFTVLVRRDRDSQREIASDPGLPVGAVIFETTRGSLDMGLETQLKEIERGFADIYPQ